MPSSSQEIPSQPRVNCAWNRAGGIYGYRVVGFLSVPPATTCRSVGELLLCCIQHPTAPSLLEVFGPIFCASCFFLSKQFIMLVNLLPTCGHGHFMFELRLLPCITISHCCVKVPACAGLSVKQMRRCSQEAFCECILGSPHFLSPALAADSNYC